MSVLAPTPNARPAQAAPAIVAQNAPQTNTPAPRAVEPRDTLEPHDPIILEDSDDDGDAPRICACLDGWLPECVVSFLETVCSWVSACIGSICEHVEIEVREEEAFAVDEVPLPLPAVEPE